MPEVRGDGQNEVLLTQRETFVPLHTVDLVEYLCKHPALATTDSGHFRQLADVILALLHHLYRQRHTQLTYAYAPLDPDRDTRLMQVPTPEERDQLTQEVFSKVGESLALANYRKLDANEINQALRAASQWGVRMRVDFSKLSRIEVYARGAKVGQRLRRTWRKLFRQEVVNVPLYQRLVVIFRTLEEHSSWEQYDSRKVYLRMFKNVPQQDVDMMLPATGIRMNWLDHSKIVLPSVYAMGMTISRVLRNVLLLTFVGIFKGFAMVVVILFAIGFGFKSLFTSTLNTRRRYLLSMAQNLYYQNLDNNAGVIMRLLEDGEQQEACEAILAYFVVAIQSADRTDLTLKEIDSQCEVVLKEVTGIDVDFDIEDAARDLVHLGLLRVNQDRWTALTLTQALQQLDKTWDSWFGA
jgi:Protein of unknown function (DUF3754)